VRDLANFVVLLLTISVYVCCVPRRNVNLLCDYEHEVDACVRRYIDQLLEEVEEAQAQVLRRADSEVIQRDSSLRYAHTHVYVSYCV
jgi:hypothetical protein